MKKSLTAASILLALILCLGAALAAGGDATDPLVSLSFLEGIFREKAEDAVDLELESADESVREQAQDLLDEMKESVQSAVSDNFSAAVRQITCNEHDTLSCFAGSIVTAHAGDVMVNIAHGTVIDATEGREIPSGTVLVPNHLYIIAENSSADFLTVTPTAILSYQGGYEYIRSDSSIDYYGVALALRELGLFRGSGSGIGEGFDLHLTPTRAEALVMFIRLLGEEDEALACTYEHTFTDVPEWLDRYAAWAVHKGYSNGIGNNLFGTTAPVSAVEYQEFLLRALGYSTAGVDDYLTSLERALECGALTDAEYFFLLDNAFLRAHVAYLSYYNLDTMLSGTYTTLAQQLMQQDVFTDWQLDSARNHVFSIRLH